MEPCGCFPFTVVPGTDDDLIFVPMYLFRTGILERGLFTRSRYLFQTLTVNGHDGRAMIIENGDVSPNTSFVPGSGRCEYIKLKLSFGVAAEIAKCDILQPDCRSWRRIIKDRNISVDEAGAKLLWRVYIVRGDTVTDSFTGETMQSAALLSLLFFKDKKSVQH